MKKSIALVLVALAVGVSMILWVVVAAPWEASPTPTPTPVSTPTPTLTPTVLPTPTPTPTPTSELQVIKEWSGAAGITTETFTIDNVPWVIQWSNEPTYYYEGQSLGVLYVDVMEVSEEFGDTVVGSSIEEEGQTYRYEKGTFYLDILAANTNWTIKVLAR